MTTNDCTKKAELVLAYPNAPSEDYCLSCFYARVNELNDQGILHIKVGSLRSDLPCFNYVKSGQLKTVEYKVPEEFIDSGMKDVFAEALANNIPAKRQRNILIEILRERTRQDGEWGEQNHNVTEWLAVLGEEFGEASQQALRIHFGNKIDAIDKYREEVIQCAAVCVAMIECLDRKITNNHVIPLTEL